jgi:hypothetical protein
VFLLRRSSRILLLVLTVAAVVTIVVMAGKWWDYQVIGNRPVEFFGRAVDQAGAPLAGVTATYKISRRSFFSPPAPGLSSGETSSVQGSATTDAEGNFHITASRGRSLSIENLAKAGYEPQIIGIPTLFAYDQRIDAHNPVPTTPARRSTYPLSESRR